ncbi:efflux RND transporter periplasmic adaptor subunit [Chitinophaga nivalis]|uniref:Efflux RND transporter periplasmic adaptor subunit n=1 Tax=Chitinophaga nivalis TaxID=2991709 RepID=A0ABT3ISB0_9BACT|nr:efflux RND transporter periplasmic adaptor subunit [Chitinophaga nivalis]MCW3463438.1 efflux RND transporter periplasmic adaptor subunit [Chitinophaga nivalis]MCW3486872.1 efflux RND transporter periplasmic adaptor subunit [Chitinophaga nivalis]
MKKNTPVLILCASAWLLLATACKNNAAPAAAATAPANYPVITIAQQEVMLHADYPAAIQGQQNIEIRPKVDGYILQQLVDEGAAVKKGQLLFRIHAPQYEQEVRTATAAIKRAAAEVATAKMQVKKVTPLVQKEIISNYELEALQFTLQAKEAELAQAQASLANAQTNLGYTTITSPADGVIGTIPYKIGSLVSSTSPQPLTTLSNISSVYAYFSFNEKQFLDFLQGYKGNTMKEKLSQLPPVTLILSNGVEYDEKGRLETISGLINTETGTVNFRATFPNPAGLIRSGGSAVVRIPQQHTAALLIPKKATYELQGKYFVFTVDKNNVVKSTEVMPEQAATPDYYVISAGLKTGDRVVADGIGSLQDGTTIQPVIAGAVKLRH